MLAKSSVNMKDELRTCYDLSPSDGAFRDTEDIYSALRNIIPEEEWYIYAPYIVNINRLKKDRSAVLLAHNYMTPEIYYGVSDFRGDSLQLAMCACKVEEDVIVQCGVHFMAETSKILNENKKVLIPDSRAGCSLASSITAEDVYRMRSQNPGARVVSYVNTSAEVKAASDVCCTSSNVVDVINAMDSDIVIVTPDQYLAQNALPHVSKKLVIWEGSCEVHEKFTDAEIIQLRDLHDGLYVMAHPECPPDVLASADFSGSTSAMIQQVKASGAKKVAMITECSMSDNVAAEYPDIDFIRPCNLCPHMKRITLENILWSLHSMTEEVVVDSDIIVSARLAITRMIDISLGVK